MGTAVLVGAAVALAGALIALIWLPSRAPAETPFDAIEAGTADADVLDTADEADDALVLATD
jgi:hypothetical protein